MVDLSFNTLRAFWFPLCPRSLLQQASVLPFTVLGRHLVIWASANGSVGALEDRCSHRSARLSQGQVHTDGYLSCPYHGWRFDPSGHCKLRPQHPDQFISESCSVVSYETTLRYGYIWLKLASTGQADVPNFPESTDPQIRQIQGFHESWNCSAYRLIENGLDNYHHHFVHGGLLETVSPIPTPIEGDIQESNEGFCYTTVLQLRNSKKLGGALGHDDSVVTVKRTVQWLAPFGISLELDWSHGLWQRIVQYAVPIDQESCIVNRFYLRNDSETDVSTAQLLDFERNLIDQDRLILESMAPIEGPSLGRGEHLIDADRPIALMRRRLNSFLTGTAHV